MATGEEKSIESRREYIEQYRVDGQYDYDEDLILGEYEPREWIEKVRNLNVQPTDVCLASYPKTGTTLTMEIVWLLRNNADEEKAKTPNFKRVPFIDNNYEDDIDKFYKLEHPRHFKTHLPYRYLPRQVQQGAIKTVYVYRNPKDALVSYYYFYKMVMGLGFFTGSWDDFFEMFDRVNKGRLYYGSILKHYREYWEHRNDPNIHITSYEALVRQPREEMKKLADFMSIDCDERLIERVCKMTTFKTMKENPATNMEFYADVCKFDVSPFMRKGEIGDWKNHFNEEQSQRLDKMIEEELGDTGMTFIYE